MTLNIRPDVQKIAEKIINIRRDIHKHPELSFKEFRTAKLVAEKLESLGIEAKTAVGKTGVVGDIIANEDGPTIALRADMDALPIQETSDVPYKSVNDGVMHACGHDAHVAMLLGVAEVLSQQKHQLRGNVRFIFQPAEEGLGGAQFMIEDGALEGVDQIFGAHVWNYQKSGTIGIRPGPFMAAADEFDITIFGKGYRASRESGSNHIGVLDLTPVSSEQGFETSINLVVKGAYRVCVKFALKEVDRASHLDLSLGEPVSIGNGKTYHHRLTIKIRPDAKQISRR